VNWFRRLFAAGLPRSVQILQLGGLLNAFGNGLVFPFLFIYLDSVRDMTPAMAGLIVGTNSALSLFSGPVWGALIDRIGPRRTLSMCLILLAVGFGSYTWVYEPWQGFLAATVAGIGNGGFWPSQSTLVAGLTPQARRHAAFAMQRVVMNLGIGLGAVAGGLIASTSNPTTFTILFLGDAATYLAFMLVLRLVPAVPPAAHGEEEVGTYRDVLANRVFMAVVGLNVLFIAAGIAQFEVLPAYMKGEAGVSELGVSIVFLCNTVLIVLIQLPIARLQEGKRRMWALFGVGVVWAASWGSVPIVGEMATGVAATALFALCVMGVAIGECLHGAVQSPLTVDLAEERMLGRYMSVSALSWSVGFAAGPAIGGFLLGVSPPLVWVAAAGACLVAGAAALALEPRLPVAARRTPG